MIPIRLICFLGNPGREYRYTRHNAPWMLIEYIPFDTVPVWQNKFKGMFAKTGLQHRQVVLLKPEVYMNKSGESLQLCMTFFKIPGEEILVVHDDLELPFGDVRIKKGNGLGGHNGLRSVSAVLGSREFHRLRIGIGRPDRGPVSSYVLSRFSMEEEAELPDVMVKGAGLLTELFRER